MEHICELSAATIATRIATGVLTAEQVTEAHLQRITEKNPTLNAITRVFAKEALAAARLADQLPAHARAPLHGVPFTVKEAIDCHGSATTFGIPGLSGNMPLEDAPTVERLKAAGAILIGRTNMSEMGLRMATENPLHGTTLNPWAHAVTAGGSSGGDAVALATGMTPLALGSDMGGSLRVPAAFCGVASLKPTRGRIPTARSTPPEDGGLAMQLLYTEGPMARTVEDLRLSFSLLAGRDLRDPISVSAPLSGPAVPRRAAVITDAQLRLPAHIRDQLARAKEALEGAGWEVETEALPELSEVNALFGRLLAPELERMVRTMGHLLSERTRRYVMNLCWVHGADEEEHVPDLHAERSRLTRLWSRFFRRYPVVVCPALTCPPWPLESDLDGNRGLELVARATPFITPSNLLGFPSVALPTELHDGLPVGLQVCSDLWREDLALEAAHTLEHHFPRPSR